MNESVGADVLVAVIWSAYLALHSAMISLTVTNYLRSTLGDRYQARVSMFVPWKWAKSRWW